MLTTLLLAFAAALPGWCAGDPVAIENVTVIPMDRERLIEDQTVVVVDGKIAAMGAPGAVTVPEGATRVDGRGKFLIPGLADMHVHLLSDYETPDELADEELFVMVANGVTTIRTMIGTPEHLKLRKLSEDGVIPGPRMFVSSPQFCGRRWGGDHFNGFEVKNELGAKQSVRASKSRGYDFIKLTFAISPEAYDAIVKEAKAQDIRVVGHVGTPIGLERALAAGQQIEHLDEYLEAILADDAPMRASLSGGSIWRPQSWRSLDHVDEDKIEEVARATAEAGVWNTPTHFFLNRSFGRGLSDAEIAADPATRFFPKWKLEMMNGQREQFWSTAPDEKHLHRYIELRYRLTKALHEAGAKLMVGSDSPEWWVLYGFGVHSELEEFVRAGLSPWTALEAATRNPAEYLGILSESGTIEIGKSADLVLLDANPLQDIRNTRKIAGVVLRGRWYPADFLADRLDEIAVGMHAFD